VFQKLLKKLAAGLNRARIPYMVIGGQAVLIYGEPRLTRDIDVSLGVGAEKLEALLGLCSRLKLKTLVKDAGAFVSQTFTLPALEEKAESGSISFFPSPRTKGRPLQGRGAPGSETSPSGWRPWRTWSFTKLLPAGPGIWRM
jgi:hypothetical protein